jgi:lipopolysaccharide export system permease protein
VYEELNAQAPLFQPDGKAFSGGGDFRPARFTTFNYATYKMDLMGFNLNRSDEDLFKDEYEMLNVFQLEDAMIATQKEADESFKNFRMQRKNERPFFSSKMFTLTNSNPKNPMLEKLQSIPNRTLTLDSFSKKERIEAIQTALVSLRNMKQNLEGQRVNTDVLREKTTKYLIEFHRKIALSATIIILFFVGAPLGAIVRKGGFGAPVVIAALLFMVYFVLFSIGENLANTNTLSPFWGMWMPTIVLAPIAFILMMAAANDLKVGDPKLWRLILSFGRKR